MEIARFLLTDLLAESVEPFDKSIFVCDDMIQILIFPASQSGWQGAYKHTQIVSAEKS